MILKIDKKDCLKKDIKIPKGYRLIEDWECLKECRTNKKLHKLMIKWYVWANTPRGIGAVRFVDFGVVFLVDGDCRFGNLSGRSRGVFVKK